MIDEWCDHSNEISSAALLHIIPSTAFSLNLYFWAFLERNGYWSLFHFTVIPVSSGSHVKRTPSGGGGVINMFYLGNPPPRGLTLHTVYIPFWQKGCPFVYLLLTNGTPFHILSLEHCIPFLKIVSFTAVIRVVTHCCVMSPIGGMGSLSNDNVWKT